MINIIKSEFKKLMWSKSFIMLFFLVIGVAIFFSISLSFSKTYNINEQDAIVLGFVNSVAVLMLYIIIFAAIFISIEFSSNTIRNYISSGVKRRNIYLGKLMVFSIGSLILVIVHPLVITSILILLEGWGKSYFIENAYVLFIQSLIYILIYLGVVSVVMLISILVRSISGAIALNIMYLTLISLSQVFLNQDNVMVIAKLLPMGQLMRVQGILTIEQAIPSIIYGVIKILLINIGGVLLLNRCEV